MTNNDILARLAEIEEQMECLCVEIEGLEKEVDENGTESEVIINTLYVVKRLITAAYCGVDQELRDTLRYLKNARVA